MRSQGAVAARVVEVDATQGRVRVTYKEMDDDLESPWAYVAAPLAGKGRGMLFMPEKGDEVLVLHGHGDFDHPYVIGYLWNGVEKAPETDPAMRVIRTPGGHQLRFEDRQDAKKVVLSSDGARRLTLDDAPAGGKIELVSTGNRVLLDDSAASTRIELQAGTSGVGVTLTLSSTPQPSLTISAGGGSTTLTIDATGVAVTTAAVARLQCTALEVTAAAAASLTAPVVTLDSALVTCSGLLMCSTLVADSVVSPLYTPGAGNLI
jgi:uncharacterized protein involved in type VI secretion and phage assembly